MLRKNAPANEFVRLRAADDGFEAIDYLVDAEPVDHRLAPRHHLRDQQRPGDDLAGPQISLEALEQRLAQRLGEIEHRDRLGLVEHRDAGLDP